MTALAWVAAGIAVLLVVAVMADRFRRRRPTGIGRQVADGGVVSRVRRSTGVTASTPIPAGRYDHERGDHRLFAVEPLPLDRALQHFVREYGRAAPDARTATRTRLDAEACATLIEFARRCAALALREPSAGWCADGLTAVAMLDETQVDRRDVEWAVALLSHALAATRGERATLMSGAAALATPAMAAILADGRKDVPLADCGYAEIVTADGPGLIGCGVGRYEPTLDLTGLALRLTAHLDRGRYLADPELAADLPSIWFGSGQRQAEPLLREARASVAVRGSLRKGVVDEPSWQMLMLWIVEMPSAEDADRLLGCVRAERRRDERVVVGLTSGRLFALVVAGSGGAGVASFETPASLRALAEEIRPLLGGAAELHQPVSGADRSV